MANKKQKNQRKQTPPQAEAPLPDLEQKIQYKDIEIPVSWVLWTILGIWYLVMSIRMMRN